MIDLSVIGYTDRLHAEAGQKITAHVSATGSFAARVIRVAGNVDESEAVSSGIDGDYTGELRPIVTGSCMVVPAGLPCPAAPQILLWIWPTKPVAGREQGIVTWGRDFGLFINLEGKLVARWSGTEAVLPAPVLERRWMRIALSLIDGILHLHCVTRDGGENVQSAKSPVSEQISGHGAFRLAGIAECEDGFYNGKIVRPQIKDGERPVADFALGAQPHANEVENLVDPQASGLLLNRPQKGMTGPDWFGDSMGWRDAPDEYDAVAFHDDDLSDAQWPETFAFSIPDDLPSDIYGFDLQAEGGRDVLPFFVVAKPKQPTADLAFVVPLFTYLAYANERHWWPNPAVEEIAGKPLDQLIEPMERWAEQRRLISAYDYHADGSGNAHASIRRPLVNLRADYVHPLLRGPHLLSGDIITLDWLRRTGRPVDIITDFCVHEHGAGILDGYKAVMTGSHPEYVTREVYDGFAQYLANGGRIIHLGGNAFYFVTSIFAQDPHVIEIRRGTSGVRPWQSEPGESRQAATGELSGIWRWRGRSAHQLLGAGTAAVSFGPGQPYRRTQASRNPDLAWMFEGVGDEEIGAIGTLLGGGAGFEVDAMRSDLGTPADTVMLAVADGFEGAHFLPPEDVLSTGVMGRAESHLLYRKAPGGGEVFAAPAVAWTSSLADPSPANAVARITGNVIDRFCGYQGGQP